MSELLAYYEQQAKARLSTLDWVSTLQMRGLSEFTRLGFPSRHDEDWKYTSCESFLKQGFSNEACTSTERSLSHLPLSTAMTIELHHGVPHQLEALSLPPGVLVLPLMEACEKHAEKIAPYLSQVLQLQHGFQALNTAMLQDGLFIYLPKEVHLSQPLLLSHQQHASGHACYLRHVVVMEAGSSMQLIEDYQGDEKSSYLTSVITEIYLAADAKLTHHKIQRESHLAYHVGDVVVQQSAGSQFTSHSMSVGGRWVRSDLTIKLSEPGAQCFLNGLYAPAEGQHVDHHTVVYHEVPCCHSEQDYKGILSGRSRAVFNGRVVVLKDAQHTEAKQQNKNLLLSAQAEIDTKPQLEIFADDVVCTHGATVGQLDEEALFYLATRGIDRVEANGYLVHAFAADNLKAFGLPELTDWFDALLNQQLG